MNLPSHTRAAIATGSFSALLLLSAAAATPPDLQIAKTSFAAGAITSGASAQLNAHVYFAGGHPKGTSGVTNAVTDFNLATGTVSALPPMPTARAGLGLVGFLYTPSTGAQNVLFAIGGVDASGNPVGAVEMYSFKTGSWTALPSLPTPRSYLSVVAGTDNNVYAIGGIDASGHSVSKVERFNQISNTWSAVANLNTARSHFGAVFALPDTIYAVGGIDDDGNALSSTEVYILSTGGPWFNWFSMNQARSDFGIATAGDGFLHVFGGHSSTGVLNSVEGYNFGTAHWTVEPETLPSKEHFLAGVEGLDGNAYLLGGERGDKTFPVKAAIGVPPAAASHSVVFFMHGLDLPEINGNPEMDEQVPLNGTVLQLGLLQTTNWTAFPAINGTISGTVTVNIPTTIGLGVISSFTLYASDLDGSNSVELGSVSGLLGLGLTGTVTIPLNTSPLVLKNKVLTLSAFVLVGLNLNLSGQPMYMTINGLTGTPTNQ
jgi:Kelch motif